MTAARKMPAQKPGASEQEVCTPPEFIVACQKRWRARFAHDLAATKENTVAATWFGPGSSIAVDALAPATNWQRPGLLWLNPPFGMISHFAARCRREAIAFGPRHTGGAEILMLGPAAVSTNWFAEHVHLKARVVFVRPRICFVGHTQGFPKDLAIMHFGPKVAPGYEMWKWNEPEVAA